MASKNKEIKHKRYEKQVASVLKAPRSKKVRWQSEKPLKFPCKVYKLDTVSCEQVLPENFNEATMRASVKHSNSAAQPPILIAKTLLELAVSEKLAKALNGQREAANPAGRVDVLTSEHVIEVKEACNWKHGIGQALIYSFYYPGRKPMLYLFGENLEVFQEIAKQHCDRFGIEYRDSAIA